MKLHVIHAEDFKLDGGACFGLVPKSIWALSYPPDENNMLNTINRLLLIEAGDHKILIDSGIGDKQDEKYLSHFYISGNDVEMGLKEKGFSTGDITDVILTHLHFDHVGGCLRYNSDRSKLISVFPNATHYCTKAQWDWAIDPNPREKASYHNENYLQLLESGHMEFIYEEQELFEGVFLKIVNGHTQGQIIPVIDYNGRKVVFMGDFIASVTHIPVPYVPSFDTQPLQTLKEKTEFYEKALAENYVLFFEHDFKNECCTVQMTRKGVRVKDIFMLKDLK
jgi:glyoxylase-like metal-dependent hydrolase (beta-lactamase superfamily II)